MLPMPHKFKVTFLQASTKHSYFYESINLKTCASSYVIYLMQCILCNKQYVGKAETSFNIRLNNHQNDVKKKNFKTLWPLFMDGVQLPQGYSHFGEAVYFLPLSSQKFLVLILSTSEGWKAELTLEPLSGFEHGTPGLGIQRLNH